MGIGRLVSTTTGDGVTNGLLGLGYSISTSAYNTSTTKEMPYQALVPQMFETRVIKQNLFSIAMTSKGGKLAFGGLPPNVSYEKPVVSAPIVPGSKSADGSPAYTMYQVNATYTFPGVAKSQTPYTVVMDSGSTINYLPPTIAKAVGARYQPPVNTTDGSVPCNAIAPAFGLTIGGKDFLMKKEDMTMKFGRGKCIATFQPSDDDVFIMGDAFLRSVLVVFDLGKQTLGFAKLT